MKPTSETAFLSVALRETIAALIVHHSEITRDYKKITEWTSKYVGL